MANPVNISWTGPTTYTDGRAFGQADHGGYDIEVNGALAFSVPVAWNTNNRYQFPVVSLPNVVQGNNVVRLRTVAANGQVSEWTSTTTFLYLSVPQAPTEVLVV